MFTECKEHSDIRSLSCFHENVKFTCSVACFHLSVFFLSFRLILERKNINTCIIISCIIILEDFFYRGMEDLFHTPIEVIFHGGADSVI